MNRYEELLNEADKNNVIVTENFDLSDTRLKGLYCDGVIAISNELELPQKTCILAEELGHHYTAVGNITDQTIDANRKQELKGRIVAYDKLIGLQGLINSYEAGCSDQNEVAEYLDITVEFLQECLLYYKSKYGYKTKFNDYVIMFDPVTIINIR